MKLIEKINRYKGGIIVGILSGTVLGIILGFESGIILGFEAGILIGIIAGIILGFESGIVFDIAYNLQKQETEKEKQEVAKLKKWQE